LDRNILPGPTVRSSKLADEVREAPGPGGVVGEAAGSLPEIHSNWRRVPTINAETIPNNIIGRQVPISSFLELGNPATPACHRFES